MIEKIKFGNHLGYFMKTITKPLNQNKNILKLVFSILYFVLNNLLKFSFKIQKL